MAYAKGWPSRYRSVFEMPPDVGDGLFHLLQWEGTQIIEESERAAQTERERKMMEQLRLASFGPEG